MMRVNRVVNKLTVTNIMDPYAMLMHYKRAFKLMQLMRENRAKILVLGNKNQFGIDWKGRFEGIEFDTGIVDVVVISAAPRYYQMILCLDPVLYCRALRRINLPVMMCATAREIAQYPEILEATDYLLPSPSSRHDAALRALIAAEVDRKQPGGAPPAGSRGRDGTSAASPGGASATGGKGRGRPATQPGAATEPSSNGGGPAIEPGAAAESVSGGEPSAQPGDGRGSVSNAGGPQAQPGAAEE